MSKKLPEDINKKIWQILFCDVKKELLIKNPPKNLDIINVGLIKEYTGGDKFKARSLSDQSEFIPYFKIDINALFISSG